MMNIVNQMTEKDWKKVDFKSRKMAEELFRSRYKDDLVRITHTEGECCYDFLVEWRRDGRLRRTAVECKHRDRKYDDVMIEKIKRDSILRRKRNGEFDSAVTINTYDDGEIRLANVESGEFSERKLLCPETSKVKGARRQMVWKDCVMFKNFKTCGK